MKNYFIVVFLFSIAFASCDNGTVNPPLTSEPTLMGSVLADDISISDSGSATKTRPLGSGQLNFTDRDTTIITFLYKGSSGNTAPYQLQIYDSTGEGVTAIYTFRDTGINDSLKTMDVVLPSNRDFAYYFYTLKCEGTSAQYFSIRNLKLYKK
ncbi:MAG: hypothetical protein JST55_01155 [Bacteroidetes bacterium]|nr:hypothetical protein [Bacteroidota bacterium]